MSFANLQALNLHEPLDCLFHCWAVLRVKKIFLIFNLNPSYLNVCSLPFFLLLHTAVSSLALSCLGPSELSLLQDKQVQVPQPLLLTASDPAPDHLGGPPLNLPYLINVFLVPGGPKLDTVL